MRKAKGTDIASAGPVLLQARQLQTDTIDDLTRARPLAPLMQPRGIVFNELTTLLLVEDLLRMLTPP